MDKLHHCEPLISVETKLSNLFFTNNLTVLVDLAATRWPFLEKSDKEVSCLPCKKEKYKN